MSVCAKCQWLPVVIAQPSLSVGLKETHLLRDNECSVVIGGVVPDLQVGS